MVWSVVCTVFSSASFEIIVHEKMISIIERCEETKKSPDVICIVNRGGMVLVICGSLVWLGSIESLNGRRVCRRLEQNICFCVD